MLAVIGGGQNGDLSIIYDLVDGFKISHCKEKWNIYKHEKNINDDALYEHVIFHIKRFISQIDEFEKIFYRKINDYIQNCNNYYSKEHVSQHSGIDEIELFDSVLSALKMYDIEIIDRPNGTYYVQDVNDQCTYTRKSF